MPVRHLSNMDMRWSSSLASRTFVLTSVTDSLHCSPARDKAMKSRQRKQCSFIIQLSAGGRGWSKPITQCPLTPVLPLPAPLTFFSPDFPDVPASSWSPSCLHLREAVLIPGDFAAIDVPPQPPPTTAVSGCCAIARGRLWHRGLLRCERRDGLNVNTVSGAQSV
jgi:hypothetical protein